MSPQTSTFAPPSEMIALVKSGQDAIAAGDLESALDCFEQVTVQFPESPEGHNNLGAFHAAVGNFAQAATSFARVADMLPENPNVRFNLGIARVHLGQADAAISEFITVLALTPDDPEVLNNLGVAHYLAGNLDAARESVTHALALQANYPNAVMNLCDIEVHAGRIDVAIGLCEGYLEHFEDAAVRGHRLVLLDQRVQSALAAAIPVAEAAVQSDDQDLAARRRLERLLDARQALTAEA